MTEPSGDPARPDPARPDPASADPAPRDPSRRDRTRPAELLGLSAVLAAVLGLVVLAATRQFVLALEFAGAGFIGSVVVLAMLVLAVTPNEKKGDGSDPPRGGH